MSAIDTGEDRHRWETSEFEVMGGRARRRETKRLMEYWARSIAVFDLVVLLRQAACRRAAEGVSE